MRESVYSQKKNQQIKKHNRKGQKSVYAQQSGCQRPKST